MLASELVDAALALEGALELDSATTLEGALELEGAIELEGATELGAEELTSALEEELPKVKLFQGESTAKLPLK